MNILPKKSWHVRNKRNIERVRRDEEKAQQEEEEKQKRIDLAEKEARLEILRKRARLRDKEENDDGTANDINTNKPKERNVNFFEEDNTATTNSEYESEKKAEQERLEKKLGILTYLGQSAIESQNGKPWYCDDERSKTLEEKARQRDKKLKDSMDPLNNIKKYLNVKKNSNDKDNPVPTSKKTAGSKASHGTKTMEELRSQRIRREREERQREQELLKRIYGVKDNSDQKNQASAPYRKYNSQFHPEYARQSKNRYHDLP